MRIGIDPGKKTGYAESVKGVVTRLETTDFWGVYDIVTEYHTNDIDMITIEVSSTSHLFNTKGADSKAAFGKIGQNVGAVKNQGELLVKRFADLGYSVTAINPLGKTDKKMFGRLTGWKGSSNEHTRDAGIMSL